MTSSVYDQLVSKLMASGKEYEILEHAPVVTIADVINVLGLARERLLKTLVFRRKTGLWVLAVLHGDDRLDYSKLAAAVGVSRRNLYQPTGAEVEAGLGFDVGGISPIPAADEVLVVFDAGLVGKGIVYCGLGRRDRTLKIDSNDLVMVTGAQVRPLSRTE